MQDPKNTNWVEDELNDAVRKYKNMLDARDAKHTDEPAKKMEPMRSVQSTFGTSIRQQPRFDPEEKKRRMGACCLITSECIVTTETDCTSAGGTYNGDNSSCEDGTCCSDGVSHVVATGDLSGTFETGHDSCAPDPIPGSAHADIDESNCVNTAESIFVDIDYTCPAECDPGSYPTGEQWKFRVRLFKDIGVTEHWFLSIDGDENDTTGFGFCRFTGAFVWGGDDLVSLDDLGLDPTGTHNYSLDDPNTATIHYEFSVMITL